MLSKLNCSVARTKSKLAQLKFLQVLINEFQVGAIVEIKVGEKVEQVERIEVQIIDHRPPDKIVGWGPGNSEHVFTFDQVITGEAL